MRNTAGLVLLVAASAQEYYHPADSLEHVPAPKARSGVGFEFRRSFTPNYWWVALFYPMRPQEFHDDLDALRNNPMIDLKTEPPDFAVSVAYHFWL